MESLSNHLGLKFDLDTYIQENLISGSNLEEIERYTIGFKPVSVKASILLRDHRILEFEISSTTSDLRLKVDDLEFVVVYAVDNVLSGVAEDNELFVQAGMFAILSGKYSLYESGIESYFKMSKEIQVSYETILNHSLEMESDNALAQKMLDAISKVNRDTISNEKNETQEANYTPNKDKSILYVGLGGVGVIFLGLGIGIYAIAGLGIAAVLLSLFISYESGK